MKNLKIFKSFFINFINNENNLMYKFFNFIIVFIFLFIIIFFQPINRIAVKENEVLKRSIIAKKDIKYYDKEATKRNEEIIKLNTPPIFIFNKDYIKYQQEKIKNLVDQIIFSQSFDDIKKNISDDKITFNNEDYQLFKNLISRNKSFVNNFISLFNKISSTKIIESSSFLNKFDVNAIKIGEFENNKFKYTIYLYEELDTELSIVEKIDKGVENSFKNINESTRKIIKNIINNNILPNVIYDKNTTEFEFKKRIETESKVYRLIPKDRAFMKGTLVTSTNINEINAIIADQKNKYNLNNILSTSMIILFLLTLIYLIIYIYENETFKDFKNYIFISSILIGSALYFLLPFYIGLDYTHLYYGFFIFISAFSVSLMFLYSKTFSLIFTIFLSILFFFITEFSNIESFLFIFFSGITIILFISRLNKRIDILLIGILISLINLIISIFISIIAANANDLELIKVILFPILNGILSSLLAFLIILIGESFLNVPTIFKLQELSQFSSPMLKKLFNTAIGTYNHSIIVGNLAEAASLEIGANALLAKVGGYYHDIGKLENPEYFIENQNSYNKHNKLKPSISTAIIKAHVKIGVERAKQSKLPQKVIDIIEQHHGNTLIRYFFEEALKKDPEVKDSINKMNFHYQNKNPEFPEAAIVLLADQVEAATRSLKKYTITNIEKVIDNVVDNNFQEGILDNSGLTLKNITKIKKTFIKSITGMYHPRIEYPASSIDNDKR